jgi:hypothetical protein
VSAEPVFELSIGTGGGSWDGLREVRGVRSLSQHAHPATGAVQLKVAVDEDQVIGEVLGRLRDLGTPVLHLAKSEPTLETVFVQLVGRGLEDDAEPVTDGAPAG